MEGKKRLKILSIFAIFLFVVILSIQSFSTRAAECDANSYFYPDGQKYSSVNVDVTIVSTTSNPGGFLILAWMIFR